MKNSTKSPYLNYPNNSNISYSLAIREAITKLSLSPAETIKYLNNEDSIWSTNQDDAVQCSLKVLKKFYQQLKNEIKTKNSVDSEGLIKFLARNNESKTNEVITRICGRQERLPKRRTWTQLKIADPDTPRDIRPVPSNVPRLNVNEFDSVSDWSINDKESNDDRDTSESSEVYREPFSEKLGSAGKSESKHLSTTSSSSSTPSSSSTISSSLNPNEKTLKETQKLAKNVFKIVHKVDKAISPRSQPSSRLSGVG
jgi:DNA-binding ferritin-like protein